MSRLWGKDANNLRKHSWSAGDERPQINTQLPDGNVNYVQNYHITPFYHTVYAHCLPQIFLAKSPPLKNMFSPLSTPPITNTTNL